jgi:hypothetical protein
VLFRSLAWTAFIIASWTEPARTEPAYADGPAGFRHLGFVSKWARELLTSATQQAAADDPRRRIFWINIWQRSCPDVRMPVDRIEELDRWAREMAATHYAGEGVELDGYGLIVNPRGSRSQEWHIDYATDYSTIFIPMSALAPENALQYAILPQAQDALPDPDCVDLSELAAANPWISVRQLIAP